MTDRILLEQSHDAVLHLTLNRPAKRNALSAELRALLVDALDRAARDASIGTVLLSGAGDHFCAGFDLEELRAAPDPAAVFAEATRYHHQVHTFVKPLIAAIDGSAVAGGLDLALMCDIRVATTDARFGQPQVRHGIPAAYELLATAIGDPPARELCLTGRVIDAGEAMRLGLVHRIVQPGELVNAAMDLARDIVAVPISGRTKESFLEGQRPLFAPAPPGHE